MVRAIELPILRNFIKVTKCHFQPSHPISVSVVLHSNDADQLKSSRGKDLRIQVALLLITTDFLKSSLSEKD